MPQKIEPRWSRHKFEPSTLLTLLAFLVWGYTMTLEIDQTIQACFLLSSMKAISKVIVRMRGLASSKFD